jgi:hypothetical protein
LEDYVIKKSRSLRSEDEGGWNGNNTHKHFRVNGADPTERPSNGKSKAKKSWACKRSPDKEHRFDEIVVLYAHPYRELMTTVCSLCGRKGDSFHVNTGPLPEWLRKLQEKFPDF